MSAVSNGAKAKDVQGRQQEGAGPAAEPCSSPGAGPPRRRFKRSTRRYPSSERPAHRAVTGTASCWSLKQYKCDWLWTGIQQRAC